MRIRVIAVGTRLPQWAQGAVDEYAKRMPPECRVEVCPVAAASRPRKPDVPRMLRDEAQRIEALLLPGALRVALDERGREWRTADLAGALGEWIADSRDVCMLIGGADGLMPELRTRADLQLALSRLTLPHALARVVLVEALYRAWSLHAGHPYHRA